MNNKGYIDIKERTFRFAVKIAKLICTFPKTLGIVELGRQLIRSGTSIGANVEEADGADSRKDFIYKIALSRKEARETRYWLRVIIEAGFVETGDIKALLVESDELVKILSKIIQNAKINQKIMTNIQ